MVELQHNAIEPILLTDFRDANPNATVADFDSLAFRPVKTAIKAALNLDQNELCAYCEQTLSRDAGQIDHIKPKAGPHAQQHLCFIYTNYAHSCINNRTCGQKKKGGLLPIEPSPGCNSEWTLSTTGRIEPIAGLTNNRKHATKQTSDMLGLNADSNLVDERQKWLNSIILVLQQSPDDIQTYLQTVPFRHILATII